MRKIELVEGLRVRFPGRSSEFDEGVEIGVLAALMSIGERAFSRRVAVNSAAQARSVAEALGYTVALEDTDGGWVELSFSYGKPKPVLRLVHSR